MEPPRWWWWCRIGDDSVATYMMVGEGVGPGTFQFGGLDRLVECWGGWCWRVGEAGVPGRGRIVGVEPAW